jgi:hypothetical protein
MDMRPPTKRRGFRTFVGLITIALLAAVGSSLYESDNKIIGGILLGLAVIRFVGGIIEWKRLS